MSPAEGDLLYPDLDSLLLSDYEDFSRGAFLLDEVDGFALSDNFDCKRDLEPLLVTELNEIGSSLADIKEEDEEEEEAGPLAAHCLDAEGTEHRGKHVAMTKARTGLTNESMQLDSTSSEQKTLQTFNEDNCMPLEDAVSEPAGDGELWHASPFKHNFSIVSDLSEISITLEDSNCPLTLLAQGDTQFQQVNDVSVKEMSSFSPLPCTQGNLSGQCSPITAATNGRHVDTKQSRTPSVFNFNSPLCSPTSSITAPDRCPMFEVVGLDENGSTHQANTIKMVQPTFAETGALPLPGDVYQKTLSDSSMQDGPCLTGMHRSQSSHSLGQFRLSGQHGTYPEEFCPSPIHVQTVGYACPSDFTHYQPACSFGLAERCTTMPMRRVFSADDIQASHGMQSFNGDNSASHMEQANSGEHLGFKVGYYTLEERKLRVHRYRQKRNERNFSRKITYACRKTLADSRLRVRGRFARMLDDCGELLVKENDDDYEEAYTPAVPCSLHHCHTASCWNARETNVTNKPAH